MGGYGTVCNGYWAKGKRQKAKGNGQWTMDNGQWVEKYCITHTSTHTTNTSTSTSKHKHLQTNKQKLQSLFYTFTTSYPTLLYSHASSTPREVWCSVTKPRERANGSHSVCVFPMNFWPSNTSECGFFFFFLGEKTGGKEVNALSFLFVVRYRSLYSFSSFDGQTGLVQHWV